MICLDHAMVHRVALKLPSKYVFGGVKKLLSCGASEKVGATPIEACVIYFVYVT